jgi:hypothetical protein
MIRSRARRENSARIDTQSLTDLIDLMRVFASLGTDAGELLCMSAAGLVVKRAVFRY